MGKLAEAYVDIVVDERRLDSGLASSKKKISGFLTSANAILGRLAFGAGVGAIGAAGTAMFMAAKKASDLGESVSKVDVTFGKSARHIHQTADDLARQFGVVKRESLDAGAAFGLMGKAAGMADEEAAKLGASFVKLGVDLASYHNVSNEEAFLRLRSGLAGEAEPLRRMGILLSEDAVKAEALAMGLTKVKRELTEGEKVRARMSLIMKQAGVAIGDRARTADSTANKLKQAMGDAENAATEFGQELADGLTKAIKLARDLATVISKMTGGKEGAKGFGETVAGAVQVADVATGESGTGAHRGKFFGASALKGALQMSGLQFIPGVQKLMDDLDKSMAGELGKEDQKKFGKAIPQAEIDEAARRAKIGSPKAFTKEEKADVEPTEDEKRAAKVGDQVRAWMASRQAKKEKQVRDAWDKATDAPRKFFDGVKRVAENKFGFLKEGLELATSGDKTKARAGQTMLGQALGGGPLATIARGLVGGVERGREHLENPKSVQTFGSPEQYAQHAVEAALSSAKDEIPQKQLSVLEKIEKKLPDPSVAPPNRDNSPRGLFPRAGGGA